MKQPKACPFCGEYPEMELRGGYYRIECKNPLCPSRLTASIKANDIIAAWNTRLKPKKINTEPNKSEIPTGSEGSEKND